MKYFILALSLSSSIAFADGFKCQTEGYAGTEGQNLNIAIYNHTTPEAGTRNGAVMIISSRDINAGNKTIAKFEETNGVFNSRGADYVAKIDLRRRDSDLGGRNILGTKLSQVDNIEVLINFSYSQPIPAGTRIAGDIFINKRNGELNSARLSCVRYLKNN